LTVAQTVTWTPVTGKIVLGGSSVGDINAMIAGVIGNYADVYSDGVHWLITTYRRGH
jgi:hypothetical protein